MRTHNTIIFLIVALLALLSALYTLTSYKASYSSPRLVVNCDNKTRIFTIEPNTIIVYKWIHSVEKTPIIEVYKATPEGLILIQAKSQSFGAGHPYSAEEFNGTFHVEDGYLVYDIHYNIGKMIEIMGNPEFNGSIIVEQNRTVETVCDQFVHGVIRVEP